MQENTHIPQLKRRQLFVGLQHLDHVIANLLAGAIVSLVAIVFNISYAALIFTGPLAPYLPFGISAALIALTVSAVIVTRFSSLPILCAGPDSLTAAVMALMLSNIAQTLVALGAVDALLPTTLLAFTVATTTTGLALFVAGQIRMGKWVRYIPYPVIGGFLAGTGWIISRGAIKVMTDIPLELSQLSTLLLPDMWFRWVPGLCFGLLTLAVTRRYKHYLVVPGLFVGAVALFYGCMWFFELNRQQAAIMGLLFPPFAETAYRLPLTAPILAEVHWAVIWSQSGTLLALFFITMIDLLLVASGLELALQTNVDFDRELQVTGAANIASGFFGGFVTCLSTSRTLLNHKAGATGRLAGLVVAALGMLMLFFGAPLIAYIPKSMLGGLLLYLGLSLLVQWLYEARQKLTRPDYILVWIILCAMATAGLLPGIGVGILIATVIFTVTYSRVPIFKHDLAGSEYPSNRSRTVQQRRHLNTHGHKIRILWLQGYLFFGTASQLADHVRQVLNQYEQTLQFLILDFHYVTGADASVISSFTKVQRMAKAHKTTLIYTSLPPTLLAHLVQEKLIPAPSESAKVQLAALEPHQFPDLDRGVEWCEDQLLKEARLHRQSFVPLALQFVDLFPQTEQFTTFMGYLKQRRTQPDECLIALDEKTTDIYILENGQVSIYTQLSKQQARRVATLGAGAIFGDWRMPANGYAVADQRSQLYVLSAAAKQRLEAEEPALAVIFFHFITEHTGEYLSLANTTIDRLLS